MRAIILAAGMGTRLRPLTNDTPKALVKVNGKPMVERQIEFLLEKGIEDILIVTGYLHEKFDYLKGKYGVKLVHNDKYDVYNNIYTMYLVKDQLPGSYILEGDVYLNNNVLDSAPSSSMYFCNFRESFTNEWKIVADSQNKVTNIIEGSGTDDYILSGISYWNEEDGRFIVEKLQEVMESDDFTELYWDEIVKRNIGQLHVVLRKMKPTDSFEIDNVEELRQVENILNGVKPVSV
ncbi:NTP transferase domain-containing protein [Bacillus tianshenii]|uniref:sugar phosphate nucleotidyltransferase n=1 Tax=Sutcliffiella tianshenii TaxID=1463404 RepID=UPI001CD7B980|nr:sugar phosphate nucleotidyltransferase [Bacillus tianshenii]MCA1320487.1 NTP transferase domain-containing protein [Bacillus tianshenii]